MIAITIGARELNPYCIFGGDDTCAIESTRAIVNRVIPHKIHDFLITDREGDGAIVNPSTTGPEISTYVERSPKVSGSGFSDLCRYFKVRKCPASGAGIPNPSIVTC